MKNVKGVQPSPNYSQRLTVLRFRVDLPLGTLCRARIASGEYTLSPIPDASVGSPRSDQQLTSMDSQYRVESLGSRDVPKSPHVPDRVQQIYEQYQAMEGNVLRE